MTTILYRLKQILKTFVPSRWRKQYHRWLALSAAVWYRHPSRSMIVMGVTGTNGKSTTTMMIGTILKASGYRVGWISTATIRVGDDETLNTHKMTMLGRWQTQRLLHQMKNAGCAVAIIETSSQGLAQYRHEGIDYDTVVFTNLTPEHIEAHGGFEEYKQAKGVLFRHLSTTQRKTINGRGVPKVMVVNADDPNASYFLQFPADEKIGFSINKRAELGRELSQQLRMVTTANIQSTAQGSTWSIDGCPFALSVGGRFNAANALTAVAATRPLDIPLATCADALKGMTKLPGRVEFINEGQPFTVLIDYAPEPESLRQLYTYIDLVPHQRLIHLLGSAGGGRDKARRSVLGNMVAQKANIAIVTNEDPYDEPPMRIINEIATAARFWKTTHPASPLEEVFEIRDRKKAIERALTLAKAGDVVLATGKGCEQAICVAHGRTLPWDEREAFRNALRSLHSSSDTTHEATH